MGKSRGKESWHYCCWKHSIAIIKSGAKGSPFVVRWCSKLLPQRKKKQHHQIDKWQTDFHFLSGFFCCLLCSPWYFYFSTLSLSNIFATDLRWFGLSKCNNKNCLFHFTFTFFNFLAQWLHTNNNFWPTKNNFSCIYIGTDDFCMRSVD